MINSTIEELRGDIEGLSIVEQFGGLARGFEIETAQGISKRYPISSSFTSQDCENPRIYTQLIPDNSKKSILYFEELTPLRNAGSIFGNSANVNSQRLEGSVRLVCWFNLGAMGFDNSNPNISEVFAPALINAIQRVNKPLSPPFDSFTFSIVLERFVEKNLSVFEGYDYDRGRNFFLYPYDFFALDFNVSLMGCYKNEIPKLDNPINCIKW